MRLDQLANQIFIAAYTQARIERHEYFTPEHLLYATLCFDSGKEIIHNSGGKIEDMILDMEAFFKEYITVIQEEDPIESVGLYHLMNTAEGHAVGSQRKEISLGDILVSMFEQTESFAAYVLSNNGVERLAMLRYISHGISVVQKTAEESYTDTSEGEMQETAEKNSEEGFLKAFATELTDKAREGEIDPLIGRENILRRTIQVLSRRLKNNPIHVGDPGVGKTAIVEGLAAKIVEGNVPKALQNSKIFYLDMGAMLAGTKYRGDFEERLKKVLHKIEEQKNAIVYIDEIHTVVGAGAVSGGAMDASNILKPYLTAGRLRFIGSTTYEEYKKFFDKDRALSRRFQKIEVAEPSVEDTYQILLGLRDRYENYHHVRYTEKALRLACELSAKYIQDRHLPDKAVDVMDEAGAAVRMEAGEDTAVITITEREIEQTIALIAKIPEQSVSGDEIQKLRTLEEELGKEIFGQEEAIQTIVRAIKRSRAGLSEGEKPVASLLFVGPTGVGKTEITRQLAKSMGIVLQRFDMSEYQEKHTVARLIGAPPGYVGYEEGGLLTDAIRKTPHCVLLLDEIEKAHFDIQNVLLQIMDYGTLTDNTGKKADFRNVILIMTSNAGAREVGKTKIGFEGRQVDQKAMIKEVERIFSPEFRNRLDEIVVFHPIDQRMAYQIAQKAIHRLSIKLEAKHIKLKATDACLQWLAEKGFSPVYGAREIIRVVEQDIKTYFVDEVLFGDLSQGGNVLLDIQDGTIKIIKE